VVTLRSLLDRCRGLYPAVVSDILDQLGYRDQVMAPRVRPLYPEAALAGYARTMRTELIDEGSVDPADPYRGQIAAIESLAPGHVLVVSRTDTCVWGELMSLAARNRGAHGIIIDGYTRDCHGVVQLGFPTFVTGIHVADALGRVDVVEHAIDITCGDVVVHDGDLVLAGYDGVVVVPASVADEVVTRAEEKVSGENVVRAKLAEGMSLSQAWERYGIL
jgi:regulator of RNase E activity RraA